MGEGGWCGWCVPLARGASGLGLGGCLSTVTGRLEPGLGQLGGLEVARVIFEKLFWCPLWRMITCSKKLQMANQKLFQVVLVEV